MEEDEQEMSKFPVALAWTIFTIIAIAVVAAAVYFILKRIF